MNAWVSTSFDTWFMEAQKLSRARFAWFTYKVSEHVPRGVSTPILPTLHTFQRHLLARVGRLTGQRC